MYTENYVIIIFKILNKKKQTKKNSISINLIKIIWRNL